MSPSRFVPPAAAVEALLLTAGFGTGLTALACGAIALVVLLVLTVANERSAAVDTAQTL